jgi:hypothetical protein
MARAGAWVRPAGGVYTRAGVGAFIGRGAFLLAPGAPEGRFRSLAAEGYGEFGLGGALELDVSLRWVDNRHRLRTGRAFSNRGLEDAEILIKWAPLNGARAVSLLGGVRVALYPIASLEELAEGRPRRGPGGQDLLLGAAYGWSFRRGWVNVDVLLRLRLGGASAGVRTRLELGGFLVRPLAAAATVEIQPAFGREQDRPLDAPAPVPTTWGLGGKLLGHFIRGVGVSVDFTWYPGRLNDGPGYRLGGGLTYQR